MDQSFSERTWHHVWIFYSSMWFFSLLSRFWIQIGNLGRVSSSNCPEQCPRRKTDQTFILGQHNNIDNSNGGETDPKHDVLCPDKLLGSSKGVEITPFEIRLQCERCFYILRIILNLISPGWTNSLCLWGRYLASPKLHFWQKILRDDNDTVSQNIRLMTVDNKHSILDHFRVGFSWNFPSEWCKTH
jgi:hypothetical protein